MYFEHNLSLQLTRSDDGDDDPYALQHGAIVGVGWLIGVFVCVCISGTRRAIENMN